MSNRSKPTSALFPVQSEFPESRKMSETLEGNLAIYEFFDHLLAHGYVLARRDPESGALRAMKTRPTVEHEVLAFRGVDKFAYALERDAMRVAYPHIWAKYGLAEENSIEDVAPAFAEPVKVEKPQVPLSDDAEVSLAEAWRRGVFTLTPSHSGVRVKIARCKRLYPEIMPKVIYKGSMTLYRAGDLREWEQVYTERAAAAKAAILFDGGQTGVRGAVRQRDRDAEVEQVAGPVEVTDALAFLMRKIRGEEE